MWNANNSLQKRRPFLSPPPNQSTAFFMARNSIFALYANHFFDYLYNLKSAENYPYIHCTSTVPKWLHITAEDESENTVKKYNVNG